MKKLYYILLTFLQGNRSLKYIIKILKLVQSRKKNEKIFYVRNAYNYVYK